MSDDAIELNDYQSKLQAWLFWNSQSTEFKLNNPEPSKPREQRKLNQEGE